MTQTKYAPIVRRTRPRYQRSKPNPRLVGLASGVLSISAFLNLALMLNILSFMLRSYTADGQAAQEQGSLLLLPMILTIAVGFWFTCIMTLIGTVLSLFAGDDVIQAWAPVVLLIFLSPLFITGGFSSLTPIVFIALATPLLGWFTVRAIKSTSELIRSVTP